MVSGSPGRNRPPNVQRADLNALEEAAGYAQLGADYGYSHGDIARVVGKSRKSAPSRVVGMRGSNRPLSGESGVWPFG